MADEQPLNVFRFVGLVFPSNEEVCNEMNGVLAVVVVGTVGNLCDAVEEVEIAVVYVNRR